jgi:hypothetical protein
MSASTPNRAAARAALQTPAPRERKRLSRSRLVYLSIGVLCCFVGLALIVNGALN